jgi:hypothetical protein
VHAGGSSRITWTWETLETWRAIRAQFVELDPNQAIAVEVSDAEVAKRVTAVTHRFPVELS